MVWVSKMFLRTSSEIMWLKQSTTTCRWSTSSKWVTHTICFYFNLAQHCILEFIMCHSSTDTFQTKLDGVDYALLGQPLSQHYVSDVIECFRKCRDDSQCLSSKLWVPSSITHKEVRASCHYQKPGSQELRHEAWLHILWVIRVKSRNFFL